MMGWTNRLANAAILAAGVVMVTACGQAPVIAADAQTRASASRQTTAAVSPVVVELYQSQGCSSCPPADLNVNALAARPNILALSFAVTYWDQLGWKDTFGSPAFTARQWDYARHAGRAQVATPQVIINGGSAIVGSNSAQLDALIARIGPPRNGPALAFDGSMIRVAGASRAANATIWLIRYDPRTRNVAIRAGENGGRTIPHRNIVRQLVKLGQWTGGEATFPLPRTGVAGLKSAVLVQQGVGGPIIASRKL